MTTPGMDRLLHPGDEVDVHVGGEAIGRLVHALGAQQLLIQHPRRVPHLVLSQAAQVQLGQGRVLIGTLTVFGLLSQVKIQAQAAQQLLRRGQGPVLLFLLGGGLIGCAVPAGEEGLELVEKALLLGAASSSETGSGSFVGSCIHFIFTHSLPRRVRVRTGCRPRCR